MKHIPNILSFTRILMIPFFVWQVLKGNAFNAGIILAISGLTDFLDGTLARRNNWITPLGKILDPIADKLTLLTVSIVLIVYFKEYRIFFAILLIKDLVMLILGAYLLKKDVVIEGAKWFGKVATATFYVAIVLIALFGKFFPDSLIIVLLTLVTALEVLSALMYVPDFITYNKEHKKNS